ncbi:MAG: alpha-glucan family phosphorylase, partial [Patescibacteria group bacterium]|jgi:starch phosphorylase
MEVGLSSKIPTYSGGLGILAGDMLKAAADASFPIIGVTLLSKYGYFFQTIADGVQVESPVSWRVDDFLKPVEEKVQVEMAGETVTVGAWLCEIFGSDGYMVPLYFLHTDLPENSKASREITDRLYGDGQTYRLKQEIILGVGGVRLLKKMGFTSIEKYHMNEGHSALLALELDRELHNTEEVKKRCIFTTHTPVPSGHDKFVMSMVDELLEKDLHDLLPKEYFEQGELNMTALALDFSGYINGVAKKHTEISKTMFPNYPIHSITNGIHTQSWVSPHFAQLYDKYMPNWRKDPESLRDIFAVSRPEIWKAHFECKKQIIDYANAYSNAGLDYDFFTLGWARRFTSYKRPDFLLENVHRLNEIANKVGPIQIIYSGKSHPYDTEGKELIQKTIYLSKQLDDKVKMVYLQNYDIYLAKFMVSGVDAWVNTP